MKLAVGAGRLYIYCHAGKSWSRPVGPESSRNVGGSEEPERPAGRDQAAAPATLLRPAGPALFLLPGGERQTTGWSLEVHITSFVTLQGIDGPTKVVGSAGFHPGRSFSEWDSCSLSGWERKEPERMKLIKF